MMDFVINAERRDARLCDGPVMRWLWRPDSAHPGQISGIRENSSGSSVTGCAIGRGWPWQ